MVSVNLFADMHHLVRRGWRFSVEERSVSAFYDERWRFYEQYPSSEPGALQDALHYVVDKALEAQKEIGGAG